MELQKGILIMPTSTISSLISVALITSCLIGCAETRVIDSTATEHERITIASVQSIKPGDTNTSVIERLGTPEIITSNEDGGETWVYDKITVLQETESGATGVFSRGSTSVRTSNAMIVTVYFDNANKVTDVKYRNMRY
ncbi:hypothetical protein BST95_19070 [Halioglobus japonicus]|uniref:Outer membrane protein assembly factor BamE n=1 Tax=Halioglobus japonicus TaxID=930805 RepID=A0AAP8MBD8_9GAMM|nr:outer membrane protein assembly factor BamE [Halioglobus japonicus]AQA20030.1 hypothetical protein BST95_19070 [Halioglobus japonicus]PLW84686.1 outer membrane protein assembly factor BamE [Halioglobus japonicus]GHD20902.1 hypothetical protein GCM10007052_31030 [Halioglobus japonicus]